MENSVKFYTHISSKKSWFNLNLREVWRYRDLIFLFYEKKFCDYLQADDIRTIMDFF